MMILNLMPINLSTKLWFYLSAAFSLSYFVLAICEIIHIIYNHFYPDYDWQEPMSRKMIDHINLSKKLHFPGESLRYIIWSFIAILLLVVILPVLHI